MRRIAQILVTLILLSLNVAMAKQAEGSGALASDPQPLWRSAEGAAVLPLAVSSLPIGGLARSIFVGWIVLYGAFQKKLLPKVKKDGAEHPRASAASPNAPAAAFPGHVAPRCQTFFLADAASDLPPPP